MYLIRTYIENPLAPIEQTYDEIDFYNESNCAKYYHQLVCCIDVYKAEVINCETGEVMADFDNHNDREYVSTDWEKYE